MLNFESMTTPVRPGFVTMNELPYDAYDSLEVIFSAKGEPGSKSFIQQIRTDYKIDCFGAAQFLKSLFNAKGFLAEIITFKNGNAFAGINVYGNVCTHHTVVLMGEWVIDILHSDKIIKTKNFIVELQKHNPNLRLDATMSTGWYSDAGFPYMPSLEDLIQYQY